MKAKRSLRMALLIAVAVGTTYIVWSCETKKVSPTAPGGSELQSVAPSSRTQGAYEECILKCIKEYREAVKKAWQEYHECMEQYRDELRKAWREYSECMRGARTPKDRRKCFLDIQEKLRKIRAGQRECFKELREKLREAREEFEACKAGCKHDQGGGG